MTVEELQAEAEKLGYKLVKIQERNYIPLKPCPVCGKKNTSVLYGSFGKMFRMCNGCDFEGNPGYNETDYRLGWNNAVEAYLKSRVAIDIRSVVLGNEAPENRNGVLTD